MESCLGMMMIPPSEFWNMSPIEMYAAVKGFKEFHTSQNTDPMNTHELENLMELYPD